jgi:hypothetical protein
MMLGTTKVDAASCRIAFRVRLSRQRRTAVSEAAMAITITEPPFSPETPRMENRNPADQLNRPGLRPITATYRSHNSKSLGPYHGPQFFCRSSRRSVNRRFRQLWTNSASAVLVRRKLTAGTSDDRTPHEGDGESDKQAITRRLGQTAGRKWQQLIDSSADSLGVPPQSCVCGLTPVNTTFLAPAIRLLPPPVLVC